MDKIANYQPQQNSVGSKLLSIWAESPRRELLSVTLQPESQ